MVRTRKSIAIAARESLTCEKNILRFVVALVYATTHAYTFLIASPSKCTRTLYVICVIVYVICIMYYVLCTQCILVVRLRSVVADERNSN